MNTKEIKLQTIKKLQAEIRAEEMVEENKIRSILEQNGVFSLLNKLKNVKIDFELIPGFIKIVGITWYSYWDEEWSYDDLEIKYIGTKKKFLKVWDIQNSLDDVLYELDINDILPKDIKDINVEKILDKIVKNNNLDQDDVVDIINDYVNS